MSDMRAALEDLDRCDLPTLLHYFLPCLDAIDATLQTILERTAPKSECVFCDINENRDSHHSGRCPRFNNSVSRTSQATTLRLCLQCLEAVHTDQCNVMCSTCGLDHNTLLCHQRKPQQPQHQTQRQPQLQPPRHHQPPHKRPRYWYHSSPIYRQPTSPTPHHALRRSTTTTERPSATTAFTNELNTPTMPLKLPTATTPNTFTAIFMRYM